MTYLWSFRWQMVVVASMFMVFLTNLGTSQPETSLLTQSCSAVNATNLQVFFSNLNETYREIRGQLSNNNTYFATSNRVSNSDPVYVMAQCRKYMSSSDCVSCFDVAASLIRSCGAYNGARSVLDGCFLRYESSSFTDQTTLPGENRVLCGESTSSQQSVFETAVDGLLSNLSIATPKIKGFYGAATTLVVGTNTSTAYAIAQCVETVSPDNCKSCLQEAYANIRSCASDVTEGRAVNLGCFMRYSNTAFFRNNQTIDIAPFLRDGSSSNKLVAIIGAVVGGLGGLIFWLIVVLWWYGRSKRRTPEVGTTGTRRSKDYSYIDLKKATNDFSDENKLGEGGFGDVYKAILDDNKVVAVKKLKVGYARAKVGFENEILLISQVRHRNLLGLLGWCIDGPNLLLVLEYMPNGSLDRFLWGERKGTLNWKQRYDIILGIARGLAHLHMEFHVRIVHRDIKSSNILLDDDLQPKVADFGLARFHPEDQSHVITKFVGTLGYTAPEYVRYGVLSDKVDTFSFGIVVLEIISGRMCTSPHLDGPSTDFLLEHAWKLYENQKVVTLVDETMNINPEEENHAKKVIEIALLCTQSPASKRPAMSEVVLMLSNDPSYEERQLTRPNLPDLNRRIHIGS